MEETLSKIVKEYISKELEQNPPPEKESSASQSSESFGQPKRGKKKHIRDLLDPNATQIDCIQALQKCLERKGVVREMQTFLRHRLSLILQERWPSLSTVPPSQMISPAVVKLMQDFLCCRKLLYTFSVMASEIGVTYSSKAKFGKLPSLEAERLLEEFDIKTDSKLSQRILKIYADRANTSLLECLIQALSWYCDEVPPPLFTTSPNTGPLFSNGIDKQNPSVNRNGAIERMTSTPISKLNSHTAQPNENEHLDVSMYDRLIALQKQLEESKQSQLQREMKRFKEAEIARIKEELRAEMKLQLITKETQLLQEYNTKLDTMTAEFEQEKANWFETKEREISSVSVCRKCSESFLLDLKNSNAHEDSPKPTKSVAKQNLATRTVIDQSNDDHEQELETLLSRRILEIIPSKETRLRESISKLQEENKRLAEERNFYASQSRTDTEESFQRNKKLSNVDSDPIAFLKYNLERQSEEITELKRKLYLENHHYEARQDPSRLLEVSDTSYEQKLMSFLLDSKERCSDIAEQSKAIENKVLELKYRRSRLDRSIFSCVPASVPLLHNTLAPLSLSRSGSRTDKTIVPIPSVLATSVPAVHPTPPPPVPILGSGSRTERSIATSIVSNVAPDIAPVSPCIAPAIAQNIAASIAPNTVPSIAPAIAQNIAPAIAGSRPTIAPAIAASRPTIAPDIAPAIAVSRSSITPDIAPAIALSRSSISPNIAPAIALSRSSITPDIAPAIALSRSSIAPDTAPAIGPSRPSITPDIAAPAIALSRSIITPDIAPAIAASSPINAPTTPSRVTPKIAPRISPSRPSIAPAPTSVPTLRPTSPPPVSEVSLSGPSEEGDLDSTPADDEDISEFWKV